MSGTSLDGLDVAFCKISNSGENTAVELVDFETISYSTEFKDQIRKVFTKKKIVFQDLVLLNEIIGTVHGEMVLECLEKWNITTDEVDVIASHGQTVFHAPKNLHQLEGYRVMVVDDNATNRQILENYLHAWKADAVIAKSGAEALDYLEQSSQHNKPFDVLLLDWFMPQMDGITLARTIRTDQRYDKIPIVMLTSYGLSQEKQQQAGIQAAITKPIRSVTLRDILLENIRSFNHSSADPLLPVEPTETYDQYSILLAEDNKVNALIAITMLESLNMKVSHVTTGKQALKAMRMQPYQLVLMDINMPEMDGYTATRYIRKWEKDGVLKQHTPVIAMTANALQGDRERCLSMGMDDYIPKPVKQQDLLKIVRLCLKPEAEFKDLGMNMPV